jgi:heterodisulfide reductase subunit A-like polyferredoxin
MPTSWVSLGIFLYALSFPQLAIAGEYPLSVLNKDVVILGGGASGTYAAVRLREDYGKSVFLVEQEAVLVCI